MSISLRLTKPLPCFKSLLRLSQSQQAGRTVWNEGKDEDERKKQAEAEHRQPPPVQQRSQTGDQEETSPVCKAGQEPQLAAVAGGGDVQDVGGDGGLGGHHGTAGEQAREVEQQEGGELGSNEEEEEAEDEAGKAY